MKSNPVRQVTAGLAGLAVASAGLVVAVPSANANPLGTDLVISEVYVNGGSSNATFTNKFVELYNPTSSDISLAGKTLQYRAPTSTGNAVAYQLTGTVPAGKTYLIQGGSNGAVGAALPTADLTVGINPGGGGGTVMLVNGTAATLPTDALVLDRVGWGTSNAAEGAATSGNSVTKSLSRNATYADTDANDADFAAGAPSPTNAAGDTYVPPEPGGDETLTIAEIQGTGDTSPKVGVNATTTGVVTGKYPAGGLNGFFIQTGGPDTTPDASDGLFVYAPGNPQTSFEIGDTVTVTGNVSEFSGGTQVTASTVVSATTPQPAVVAKTVVPGTDCALPGDSCLDAAALAQAREKVEAEYFKPTGEYTVTDAYDGSSFTGGTASSANYGDVGLAAESATPLFNATEVVNPNDAAALAARKKYNDAHRVILDDGSSWNFAVSTNGTPNENTSKPMPYQSADHVVRVGAKASFPGGVVLNNRNNIWAFQPTTQVVGTPSATQPQFTQTRKATPEPLAGDLKLATFNVLNYFTTLGSTWPAGCTSYKDREGVPNATNTCQGNGPRGAWDAAGFERQQTKIVKAINALGADVVSLEELENSRKVDNANRDEAIGALVAALNADAGSTRWAFAPSPTVLPAVADEDVIRMGFIYDPATVELSGPGKILTGSAPFANAREPLAQAFKPKGGSRNQRFAVVVNHFKSKSPSGATGDNVDPGTGVGGYNGDRTRQAGALATFAKNFASAQGIDKIFLTGDFNAYSQEDPITTLEAAGFANLESTTNPNERSYSFDGGIGSLDHVFANDAANAWVKGVDIWEINANENVYRQYSRYNANVTDLYAPDVFGASDHNPEIIGFTPDAAAPGADPIEVQVLGTNDFHGRLLANGDEAGAAQFAGAVAQLRAENPNTVFAAGGDLIGASTFESFIQQDKPTLDALNAAGLDVSAAGNHEFDAGYEDLTNRVMAPYDATNNPHGGAAWQYLAANVRKKSDNSYALPDVAASPGTSDGATWIKDVAGVKVGFIGAVTEDLPTLVSPGGIADLKVSSIIDETNTAATRLKADGAEIIVLLTHEGAEDKTLESAQNANTAFGKIVAGVNDDVDAIISGHTHLDYNHFIDGRPVVSAGQYGTNLNQLVFHVDPTTREVTLASQEVIKAAQVQVTAASAVEVKDEVTGLVTDAKNEAEVLGAKELGKLGHRFGRAKLSDATDNRGGESTLGNLVAEVQRWATDTDIAFMNPGGLREDMAGTPGGYPATLTYKQAAVVQPFANTLVKMNYTGAQLKTILEQQWQRDAKGAVPTRPFLRLGTSAGFKFSYDPARAEGDRITGMWLDGKKIVATQSYSVTMNSFLATGGDNFREFANGTAKADTGQSDLNAMVEYMAAQNGAPVTSDWAQHAVGISTPADAPSSYKAGESGTLTLSSLSFTAADDKHDTEVLAKAGDTVIGRAAVDNTLGMSPFDEYGTATLTFTIPAGARSGAYTFNVVGETTGTSIPVTVQVAGPKEIQILGTNDFHGRLMAGTGATGDTGAEQFAGAVAQLRAENPNTVFAAGGDLIGATTFESFIQKDKPTLDVMNAMGLDVSAAGNHEFDQGYSDLTERVMAPYDAASNPEGGAEWQYLAANVRKKSDDSYALPDVAASPGNSDGGTWTTTVDGVKIGFVGTVTENLPSLVTPGGIADVKVTSIIDETNAAADRLKADGAEIVVMLTHEGATETTLASAQDTNTAFGKIVAGVDNDVDAIVSGHTHLAYNHSINGRPVVSAGQYGANLNRLVFNVAEDGTVSLKSQEIVAAKSVTATDPEAVATKTAVAKIVKDASTKANELGSRELGKLGHGFGRAKLADKNDNRGGESTLGNLVAEVQRWATDTDIALMNPGGLRDDMMGSPGGYPAALTYKQAAAVQPFANTLVKMNYTGAQLKTILEQQWQRDGKGQIPERPFLRLGTSKGFTFTYDVTRPEGDRITGMRLNGVSIDPAQSYSVTVNSFLASGGDNFFELAKGADKADTGQSDLNAMVEYMAAQNGAPVTSDWAQHAVGISMPDGEPSSYRPGERGTLQVSSLAFTAAGDKQDSKIWADAGNGVTLGSAAVDNTASTTPFDEAGKASLEFVIPDGTPEGPLNFTIRGDVTGTAIPITVQVESAPKGATTTTASAAPTSVPAMTGTSTLSVTVAGDGAAVPTGLVTAQVGDQLVGGGQLVDGTATFTVGPFADQGAAQVVVKYLGSAAHQPSQTTVALTVTEGPVSVQKQRPTLSAAITPRTVVVVSGKARATVTVTRPGGAVTGTVLAKVGTRVVGAGDLVAGRASFPLQPFASVGQRMVTFQYLGDSHTLGAQTRDVVTVLKAAARVKIQAPKRIKAKARTAITVRVLAPGQAVRGKLKVRVAGKIYHARVVAGAATVRIKVAKPGRYKIRAVYAGNALIKKATAQRKVRVTR